MQIIRESAEHHFLTMLEKIKKDPSDWIALRFALSNRCRHADMLEDVSGIKAKMARMRDQAEAFLNQCMAYVAGFESGFLYLFSDNDVVLIVKAKDKKDKITVQTLYKDMAAQFEEKHSDSGLLVNELYNYQRLADQKLLSARRIEAYKLMQDLNKIGSIGLRRMRREATVVLMVEDDRFTAAYTAGILNKEFDLILCRTGEEAISAYIEHAPDIVLMDIHLPGLSGHETLQAIHAVDEGAFVVMLSVDTVKKSIEKASLFGAKSFLKKPFSKERLLNTVMSSPFVRGHYLITDPKNIH